MKKILILFLLLIPINTYANTKLKRCIDGDTAVFIIDKEKVTVRFLSIDTPEINSRKYKKVAKDASNYTCNRLKRSKKIEIILDDKSDKYDKYNRLLAWVRVDGELLQSELVEKGYAEVKYVFANYKYLNLLKEKEEYAKKNKLNLWKIKLK